jgi:hypothetical protein
MFKGRVMEELNRETKRMQKVFEKNATKITLELWTTGMESSDEYCVPTWSVYCEGGGMHISLYPIGALDRAVDRLIELAKEKGLIHDEL